MASIQSDPSELLDRLTTRTLGHRWPFRVRYSECDPQGFVFNSRYFEYFDMGMVEYLRTAVGDWSAIHQRGLDLVVVEATCRDLKPAKFDDEIVLEVGCLRLGTSSLELGFRVIAEDRIIAVGRNVYVAIDPDGKGRITLPRWIRDALAVTTL